MLAISIFCNALCYAEEKITSDQITAAENELADTYKRARSVLNEQNKQILKRDEIKWIKEKDSTISRNGSNASDIRYRFLSERIIFLKRVIEDGLPQTLMNESSGSTRIALSSNSSNSDVSSEADSTDKEKAYKNEETASNEYDKALERYQSISKGMGISKLLLSTRAIGQDNDQLRRDIQNEESIKKTLDVATTNYEQAKLKAKPFHDKEYLALQETERKLEERNKAENERLANQAIEQRQDQDDFLRKNISNPEGPENAYKAEKNTKDDLDKAEAYYNKISYGISTGTSDEINKKMNEERVAGIAVANAQKAYDSAKAEAAKYHMQESMNVVLKSDDNKDGPPGQTIIDSIPFRSLMGSVPLTKIRRGNPLSSIIVQNIASGTILYPIKAYYISEDNPNLSCTLEFYFYKDEYNDWKCIRK